MKTGRLFTSALIALLSLGCNGQVQVLTTSDTSEGAAGAAGAAGAGGSAGAGEAGSSGSGKDSAGAAGATQGGAGQGGSGAGTGGKGNEGGGAGGPAGEGGSSGGTAGAGEGGNTGGSAGQGGETALGIGCGWFEGLVSTAQKKTGALLFTPSAYQSADGVIALTLPPQTDQFQTVEALTGIVGATDEHVFALGSTGKSQSLVALKLEAKGGTFAQLTYLLGSVVAVPTARRTTLWSAQPMTSMYAVVNAAGSISEGSSGSELWRIDPTDPAKGAEKVAEGLSFDTAPFHVVPTGSPFVPGSEELVIGSADRLLWLRNDGTRHELKVAWAEELITGFTVESGALFYTTAYAGTIEGQVHRVEMTDKGFGATESAPIAAAGSVISFPDSGEAPAVAAMTRTGLVKFAPYEQGLTGTPWLSAPEGFPPRLTNLEYGIHPGQFQYGYWFDAACPKGGYEPVFLADGATKPQPRFVEPGFPFVQPTPWAGLDTVTGGPRLHGNKHGIYLIR